MLPVRISNLAQPRLFPALFTVIIIIITIIILIVQIGKLRMLKLGQGNVSVAHCQ